MTSTRSLPVPPADAKPTKRLGLSWTQIAAAGFASITATVILSFFSISGTLIGAAVFSMASAVGNAVYGQSLRRTQDKVLDVVPFGGRTDPASPTVVLPVAGSAEGMDDDPDAAPTLPAAAPAGTLSRRAWKRVAFFAVAIFAFVMATVTTVELIAGRPLTDLLRGEQGTGTSLTGGGGDAPAPVITKTVTPSVVVTTPTVTQTAPAATRTETGSGTTTTTVPPSDAPTSGSTTSGSSSAPSSTTGTSPDATSSTPGER